MESKRIHGMIITHKNGVSFLEFKKLANLPGIRHGIFTRNTGVSSDPFRSLNISFGVGDDDRNVRRNREIISKCLNEENLVFADQVHGNRIMVFPKDNNNVMIFDSDGCGGVEPSEILSGQIGVSHPDSEHKYVGDALVTNIRKKILVIQVADCQSVIMYDPVQQVVANVHSGWRGSINDIIGLTIKVMKKSFGCFARDIIAGIGASLGPCCAEFVNYEKEIPKRYWKYKDDNDHFNFWSLSCDQLCQAGVLMDNVNLSGLCTKCDPDRFFSFRGEGATGRFASVIGLK
jgi:YfiH family protein